MTQPDLTSFWDALDALPRLNGARFLYDERTEGGGLRRRNLGRYLQLMATRQPKTLLVGEAPGYRGTAITGVPFMSVREISASPGLLSRREADGFEVPTDPASVWEATSGAMWRTLDGESTALPLLWAAFPSHPHSPGSPRTNRRPTPDEVRGGIEVARALAAAFRIERVVAVGGVAYAALAPFYPGLAKVRHPARGGARKFAEELATLHLDA